MLLKTKLFAPPIRDNAVLRRRLLDHLAAPAPGQLTLIHGPAGYGKTTLTRQWLDHIDYPYAWLSLDQQDNDQNRFWQYLASALRLPLAETGISSEEQIIRLLNHWQESAPPEVHLLVMDDFHYVQDATLLGQISWALDRLPASLHLVLTTRNQPPINLPRRRVRNQLMEVSTQELCFQSGETRQFLEQTLNLELSTETITTLHNQTEGWIAALQLAGLSLKYNSMDADTWLDRKRSQPIMDYLAEEVLANQPELIRHFLLHVTQLRRFNQQLCESAFANQPGFPVAYCMQYLRDNDLFLIPLDAQQDWFRFHDLFRENIQLLAAKRGLDSTPTFLNNAAQWFIQKGDDEEAIFCLLQAKQWQSAAELIEQLGVSRMLAGKNDSLNSWLDCLPQSVIDQRPKLALIKAWSLFCTERVIEAEPYLDQAERLLNGKNHPALHTQILLFRAHLARFRGEEQRAEHWSRLALQQSTGTAHKLNAVTLFALGMEQFQHGWTRDAKNTLSQALATAFQEQNHFCTLSVSVLLAHAYLQSGMTPLALSVLEEVRQWLEAQDQLRDLQQPWQNIMFFTLYRETRQLDKAEAMLRPLLEQQQQFENGHQALVSIMHAILLAQGKHWKQALTCTDHAEFLLAKDQSHWSVMCPDPTMVRAALQLRIGDLDAAFSWSVRNEARLQESRDYPSEEARILYARCLILQARFDEGTTLLKTIIHDCQQQNRSFNQCRALLTLAFAYSEQYMMDAAMHSLLEAIRCAEPARFIQMFFDDRPILQNTLLHMEAQGLKGWWQDAISRSDPIRMIEPLTSRELEVLSLIADGYRNQAIADDLNIALTTTKVHIRHIYEKMSVASRTQAVAKARQLGLIN